MTKIELGFCAKLFERGGYVLDFSTADFDTFTMASVGVPLCAKYQLSKGKSLLQYIYEAPEHDAEKILQDLMTYYEASYPKFADETREVDLNHPYPSDNRRAQYLKCKEILQNGRDFNITAERTKELEEAFSSDYMNHQFKIMIQMQDTNPTEAIGKAKELIESCCKTVLKKIGVELNSKWDMVNLVDEVFRSFKIMPRDIDENIKGAKSIRQILGNLKAIAHGVAELRNSYGSGHGKESTYKGLEPRHAQLAIGSSITLVKFIWDSYERNYVTPHS